ncbi:hypothetical protein Nmel_007988 [Mimus melanotis]
MSSMAFYLFTLPGTAKAEKGRDKMGYPYPPFLSHCEQASLNWVARCRPLRKHRHEQVFVLPLFDTLYCLWMGSKMSHVNLEKN